MMPGTYCIAICLFERGGWYAWERGRWYAWHLRSDQQPAVSLVGGGTHDTYVPPKKQLYRRGYPMKSHSAADARQNQLQKRVLQALFHLRCPRNHTNVPPVDAHVWRQLNLSAVARCNDSYGAVSFIFHTNNTMHRVFRVSYLYFVFHNNNVHRVFRVSFRHRHPRKVNIRIIRICVS